MKLPRWFNLAFVRTYQEINASFDALEALGEDVVRYHQPNPSIFGAIFTLQQVEFQLPGSHFPHRLRIDKMSLLSVSGGWW